MRVAKIYLSILCCLLFLSDIKAEEKGSDVLVSIEPFFSFPAVPFIFANQALTFGFFRSGFGLQDSTTTCTFKSVFPVSGSLNLNGGQLFFLNDLIFQDTASFNSSGIILGNGHTMEFSSTITGIPAVYNTVFQDTYVYLNSDFAISGTVRFKGNCLLDGRWNKMSLGMTGNILVDRNSTLYLRNIEIDGIARSNIRCLNNGGTIIMDNLLWEQDADFTFTAGSLRFINQVEFTSSHNFIYQTTQTSTVDAGSSWYFTDGGLTIGRQNSVFAREPLYFVDRTSSLQFDYANLLITPFGINLKRGTLAVAGELILDVNSSDSTHGFVMGDGTLVGDMQFKMFPGAVLDFNSGHVVDNLVTRGFFLTSNVEKNFFRRGPGTFFYVYHDLALDNVQVTEELGGVTVVTPGKIITFDNCTIVIPVLAEYNVTGTQLDDFTTVLDGGTVDTRFGIYPTNSLIRNTNNTIRGPADIVGAIILHDNASQLTLNVDGTVLTNVIMNGGSLVLTTDLKLGQDVSLTGSGNINLLTHDLTLGTNDLTWTGSNYFVGSGSHINLQSLVSLTSTVTLSGNCTINGNGNELHLKPTGKIVVAKNSTLRFKDIVLTGVMGNNIRCFDNSAKVIVQNVDWIQDANYSFTVGSFEVKDICAMSAASQPFVFSYQTTQTAVINRKSSMIFDKNFTFSYDPINKNTTGLTFTDDTSQLTFDGANFYVTSGGMQLKKGTLAISNASTLSVEGSVGLTIGNNTSADDCVVNLSAGGLLDVLDGSFIYQNMDVSSWKAVNVVSILRMESGTTLQLDQPLNLDNGRLLLHKNSNLFQATPSSITGILEFFE